MFVDENSVQFYHGYLTDPAVLYKVGDTINFEPSDSYSSCEVGSNCWLNVYQHNDFNCPESGFMGTFESGIHDDLSSKGISIFQVIGNNCSYAIDIKLRISPPVDPNTYKLTIVPYNGKEAYVQNDNKYTQCPIPKLDEPESEIVCEFMCQELAKPNVLAGDGRIYFKYDPSTGVVSCRVPEECKRIISVHQEGFTKFTLELRLM